MGLFDAFKKKVEEKSEEINPLYGAMQNAGFNIHNMQVQNNGGNVTVTGSVEDGAILEKVNAFLSSQPSVSNVFNNIEVADISSQGIKCKVATKSSNLNVRAGASTEDEIVGKFAKDSELLLVKRVNSSWNIVRGTGIDGNPVEGYCHTDYMEMV
ncbi:MAG: SH3 domain-containing protein [Flavobacteriales bacterium]|nr:SH3 domain-containing protein [Flavobacteriales bacterium]